MKKFFKTIYALATGKKVITIKKGANGKEVQTIRDDKGKVISSKILKK